MARDNLSSPAWEQFKGFVLGTVVMALISAVVLTDGRPPLLVGIGCAGASGPLYANEEDEFPKCADIHRVN